MNQLIRWTFFGLGLLCAIVVVYLYVLAPHLLGVRRHRVENLAIGICSVVLMVGSWYQSPIGWYAGLAVCLYNILEGIMRWRRLFGGSTVTAPRVGMGIWLGFNGLLIALLLSFPGRHTFHTTTS